MDYFYNFISRVSITYWNCLAVEIPDVHPTLAPKALKPTPSPETKPVHASSTDFATYFRSP